MKTYFPFLFALFLANFSYAQDSTLLATPDEVFGMYKYMPLKTEVSGVSQYAQKIEDVPASVLVISEEQIIERGYEDLSDLLKELIGVDYVENAGRYGEYYTINGINGNDRFLVLIDGKKVNAPSSIFLSVGNSISVRFLEKVEIVYGSASVMYGSDAFAGVINLVPKKYNSINKRANLSLNYGSFNTKDVMFQGYLPIRSDISLHIFGRLYNSDGFVPEGQEFDITKRYPHPITNAYEQPISDHQIFAELQYKNWRVGYHRQYFNEGNARGISPSAYYYSRENAWKLHNNMTWANYSKTFSNTAQLNAELIYTHYTQDPETMFFRFTQVNNPASPSARQYLTGKDQSLRALFSYKNSFWQEKIDFLLGAQLEYMRSIPSYANDYVLGAPLKYTGTNAEKIDENLTVIDKRMGVFFQFTYKINPKLNLSAAGRYDYFRFTDAIFNPRLSLIYKPNPYSVFKVIYGSAFQAPSLFYRYEQFATPIAVMVPNVRQNFSLQNQKIQSIYLTYDQYFGKKFLLNSSVFYNDASNLIERRTYTDSVYSPTTQQYLVGIRNENVGNVLSSGTSMQLQYKAHANYDFQLQYALLWTNQHQNENADWLPLPRTSTHKLGLLFAARNLFQNRWSLSVRAFWFSPMQATSNGRYFENGKTPSSYVFRFFTNYKPYSFLRIYAHTEVMAGNLKQVGIFNGGVYNDYIPQAPFMFRVGLELNY